MSQSTLSRWIAGVVLACAAAEGQPISSTADGRSVLFTTSARLRGEDGPAVLRVFEASNGAVRVVASGKPGQGNRAVIMPRMNDQGEVQAWSLDTGIWHKDPPWQLMHQGVVRNRADGWEIRKYGVAGLSRDGRWAVFSGPVHPGYSESGESSQTIWVDLWSGQEWISPDLIVSVDEDADDGTVLGECGDICVYRPGQEPVRIADSMPLGPSLDRYGRTVAFWRDWRIWRQDLASGETTQWSEPCTEYCTNLRIAPAGAGFLYVEHDLKTRRGRLWQKIGEGPPRLTSPPEWDVQDAAWSGDGSAVLVVEDDNIWRIEVSTGSFEKLVAAGPLISSMTSHMAPGSVIQFAGTGMTNAKLSVGGAPATKVTLASGEIRHLVPESVPLRDALFEADVPESPFEPWRTPVRIAAIAPRFIQQQELPLDGERRWGQAVLQRDSDNSMVTEVSPARRGEVLRAWLTGIDGKPSSLRWEWRAVAGDNGPVVEVLGFERATGYQGYWVARFRVPEISIGTRPQLVCQAALEPWFHSWITAPLAAE